MKYLNIINFARQVIGATIGGLQAELQLDVFTNDVTLLAQTIKSCMSE